MNMAGHDTPRKDFHSFILLATM